MDRQKRAPVGIDGAHCLITPLSTVVHNIPSFFVGKLCSLSAENCGLNCIMALIYLACVRDLSIVVRACQWPGKDLFRLISDDQKAQLLAEKLHSNWIPQANLMGTSSILWATPHESPRSNGLIKDLGHWKDQDSDPSKNVETVKSVNKLSFKT